MIPNKTHAIVSISPFAAVHPPTIGRAPGIEPIEVFNQVMLFNGV